jgi:hypothetical protein
LLCPSPESDLPGRVHELAFGFSGSDIRPSLRIAAGVKLAVLFLVDLVDERKK